MDPTNEGGFTVTVTSSLYLEENFDTPEFEFDIYLDSNPCIKNELSGTEITIGDLNYEIHPINILATTTFNKFISSVSCGSMTYTFTSTDPSI